MRGASLYPKLCSFYNEFVFNKYFDNMAGVWVIVNIVYKNLFNTHVLK